jgi:hypothetical protein
MPRKKRSPPPTPDEAWQRLVGTWVYRSAGGNSVSVSRYRFTPDRRIIMSSELTGGIMPGPMTDERTMEVTAVAVQEHFILLTVGQDPFGGDAVMTVRFNSSGRLVVEDGPPHKRCQPDAGIDAEPGAAADGGGR